MLLWHYIPIEVYNQTLTMGKEYVCDISKSEIWDSRYIVLSWIMLGVSCVTAGMSGIKYIGIIFRLITFILPLGVTVIRFRMYM